ncbi:hypothetical protein KVR01_013027 [Diaporthe batatas]|uniref:uncharacterized protein n=1 Tax=Diaporthe batatas TaxID=748121 RepID=UPI001D047B58|nr:uncharacterized protein KVR01_013027 [Diaporthe batatas]KAG8157037.1 hypothetical protein KVR01_013027 [Diaporthe batatas]
MNLFTFVVALMPFLSFALAWPAKLEVPNDRQELTVVYHRVNSRASVDALSRGALVGRDCSATLNTGSFANLPIIFDVDERGSGNLTVGPNTYQIHERFDYSGGITCGRMYNDVEAVTSCTVTIPSEFEISPLSRLHVTECIAKDAHTLSKTLNLATRALSDPNSRNQTENIPIRPRQDCIDEDADTIRWSCGDPHQNFYHRQLSVGKVCGDQETCVSSFNNPGGVSVSYTASMPLEKWISGDFYVQQDWKTGTNYECTGHKGETVCVWYKFAHTAYRVQNDFQNSCGWEHKTDPFILFSPNKEGINGGQYCVIGPCRNEGDWYWDYNGPAGDAKGNYGC